MYRNCARPYGTLSFGLTMDTSKYTVFIFQRIVQRLLCVPQISPPPPPPLTDTMLFPDSTRWIVEGRGTTSCRIQGIPGTRHPWSELVDIPNKSKEFTSRAGKEYPRAAGAVDPLRRTSSPCSWLAPDWTLSNTDSNHGWYRTGNFPMLTVATSVPQSMQNGQAVLSPEGCIPLPPSGYE